MRGRKIADQRSSNRFAVVTMLAADIFLKAREQRRVPSLSEPTQMMDNFDALFSVYRV